MSDNTKVTRVPVYNWPPYSGPEHKALRLELVKAREALRLIENIAKEARLQLDLEALPVRKTRRLP